MEKKLLCLLCEILELIDTGEISVGALGLSRHSVNFARKKYFEIIERLKK